jgi:hypothetical protein
MSGELSIRLVPALVALLAVVPHVGQAGERPGTAELPGIEALIDSVRSGPLVLLPTAVRELTDLRINTGRKARQRDGTVNVVHVLRQADAGNKLLNFSLDVAVEAGPVVLRAGDMLLEAPATGADSLVLFVGGQRVGSVAEIREAIRRRTVE